MTLLPSDDAESKVFGVAYKIPNANKSEVLQHLDFREKNGYERHTVKFYPYPEISANAREIMIYVATEDNVSFAGHITEINEISKQVFEAIGPSGPNREYLFNLANAMRKLFPNERDEHLFELETSVLQLVTKSVAS